MEVVGWRGFSVVIWCVFFIRFKDGWTISLYSPLILELSETEKPRECEKARKRMCVRDNVREFEEVGE